MFFQTPDNIIHTLSSHKPPPVEAVTIQAEDEPLHAPDWVTWTSWTVCGLYVDITHRNTDNRYVDTTGRYVRGGRFLDIAPSTCLSCLGYGH